MYPVMGYERTGEAYQALGRVARNNGPRKARNILIISVSELVVPYLHVIQYNVNRKWPTEGPEEG